MTGDPGGMAKKHPEAARGVGLPAAIQRGFKVFSSPAGQPRVRRATDLLLLSDFAMQWLERGHYV